MASRFTGNVQEDKESIHNLASSIAISNQNIDLENLAKYIGKELAKHLGKDFNNIIDKSIITNKIDSNLVFVMMSFNRDLKPIFKGIEAAGEFCGLQVEKCDYPYEDYRITDKIFEKIKKARFLVADLTEEKPNVYFELGYAIGLKKPVIITAHEETKLHFDIQDWKCFFYNDSRVLEKYLKKRFKHELEEK